MSEDCHDIVTIVDMIAQEYRRRREHAQPCNNKTTTTTTTSRETECHDIVTRYELEHIFNLLTSKLTYRLYRGKASRETALLLNLLTSRGALTYRSRGLFDDDEVEGIFTEREDLHRVMRKLERLGVVTKSLQTPWRGGKRYALWAMPWAVSADVQAAIEEHNHSLDTKHWPEVPPPRIPEEKLILMRPSLEKLQRKFSQRETNEFGFSKRCSKTRTSRMKPGRVASKRSHSSRRNQSNDAYTRATAWVGSQLVPDHLLPARDHPTHPTTNRR